MKELLKSASRLGMLAVIFVACISFVAVVLMNVQSDPIVIGVLTLFSNLVTGITTFYYTKKQTNPEVDTTSM